MLKPYELLDGVLSEIENGLKQGINEGSLADKFALSQIHLRRLFKFAFGQTIGAYIRSRKLAASIDDLLNTNINVLDIALDYEFEYEQSYIRSFKREFGITPGELRKTGQIIKITPPLQLFDSNKLTNAVFFGPDIVIVPQFHAAGRKCKVSFRDALTLCISQSDQFHINDQIKIPNQVNPGVHIDINREAGIDADYFWFMPSVQVKSPDAIPKGYDHYTFPTSLCARFRFICLIGDDFNMAAADDMYRAIDEFMDDEHQRYFPERKRLNVDIYYTSSDGIYKLWEWFTPVSLKSKNNALHYPDGIISTYKQKLPALRFIGKKFSEPLNDSLYARILSSLDKCRLQFMFDAIEKQTDKDIKTLYEGSDSYISLIRKKDNRKYEYCLGMFMPEGTGVPDGYEAIDFPKSTLGVCLVYGKRNSIINYDAACREELLNEGIFKSGETGSQWFFQRFNWRRFFEEDRYGKRLLEYCYFI